MAILVKCKDGDCQVPDQFYGMSQLVRDFCDSKVSQKWASEHTISEVFSELNELMFKYGT